MNIALGMNKVKSESSTDSVRAFADIFGDIFGEMFTANMKKYKAPAEDCLLQDNDASVSSAAPTRTSNSQRFGPITVTTRLEGTDMFSVVWMNRMNNSSIGIHKFGKGRYVVELGLASGAKIDALNFKAIEHATSFALLNTDVTRVQEDHALDARKHFLQFLVSQEGRAREAVKFTKTAWQVNRLRGTDVHFSEGLLDHVGRLMFLLPSDKALITTTDDSGRVVKHTVPFKDIWIQ